MRREIGSEFWDVPIAKEENSLFLRKMEWFISGTAALEQILEDILTYRIIRVAAIPSWCCSSMIIPYIKRGIRVVFYPVWVDPDEGLIVDYRCTEECDTTLRLDYFGYSTQKKIGNATGIIIEDLTHSLLSGGTQKEADYYFGSLRKWAGFYTGGYAWKKGEWHATLPKGRTDMRYIRLRMDAMEQKKRYIMGESVSKEYLDLFEKGEEFLDLCEVLSGYEEDIKRAEYLDISMIKTRRRENAKALLNSFKDHAVFKEVDSGDCPLFVPLNISNEIRDGLRSYLISKEIYCPIHWPVTEYHKLDDQTELLYRKEISIVCDQRYNECDMNRIIDEVKKYLSRRA